MKQHEIGPSEWSSFLDAFSRRHEGWLVTVEEVAAAGGPRIEAREVRLQGLFIDPREQTVSIVVGSGTGDHLTHTIGHPARIVLEQSDSGRDEGLRIERQTGRSTHIRFRAPARPDEVDGRMA
jgi:hypothetical protein